MSKQVFTWMNTKLTEKKSHVGNGTFAGKLIKKGELIAIFGGHVISLDDEKKLPSSLSDIAIQIEKNFVIGPIDSLQVNNGDFFNHSCDANAGIKGQVSLYAMRDIKKGEEVSFDYGTVLFTTNKKPTYKMECLCGSKNCRRIITDHDWKINSLQKKYKGFFPFYIQEKIKKKE